MRSLAYVEKIQSLKPISGADKIECAQILGWEVVVKKGEFKVGDLVIYCEIDSILPELKPFEFLRPRRFRIRTIRLKSQISQGIIFPISILNEINSLPDKIEIGMDLTDLIGITKYDPESELDKDVEVDQDQGKKSFWERKFHYYKWKLFGIKPVKRGTFPVDVPKTDEIRVQKMAGLLAEKEGAPCYVTEKCEGTSSTFIFRKSGNWFAELFNVNGLFQVCSRNTIVYNSQKNNKMSNHHLCEVAKKLNLEEKLRKLNLNIAIQGEVIGPKIQGNIYKLPELQLKVFSIFDIDKQKYCNLEDVVSITERLGLDMVPLLSYENIVNDIKYYVTNSIGKSVINPSVDREGIVIRDYDNSFSFKSINPEYLLANNL